jgi:hypothetical protein
MKNEAKNLPLNSVYYLDTLYPAFGKEWIVSLQNSFDGLTGAWNSNYEKLFGDKASKNIEEIEKLKQRRMRLEFSTAVVRSNLERSLQANIDVLTGKKTIKKVRDEVEMNNYHLRTALAEIENKLDFGKDPILSCNKLQEILNDTTGKYDK